MDSSRTVYVLGSGAVGFPLAVFLADAGRPVVAVRTSRADVPRRTLTVTVSDGERRTSAPVETVSLSDLTGVDGIIAVTSKAYANAAIARALREKGARGPVVIMQNGVGVERPFLEAGFSPVYRCVVYVTSQSSADNDFWFRSVAPSAMGVVEGDAAGLAACVAALSTEGFPFRVEPSIQREVWKKAIINCVFNSICPLLDVDNGVFVRDADAMDIAAEVVRECVTLAQRFDMDLGEDELMEQIRRISERSDGQLISTLQDLRAGRPTEIESLNLEIARIGAAMEPAVALPRVELLGRLIRAKSAQGRR